jgi:hypothetical protein
VIAGLEEEEVGQEPPEVEQRVLPHQPEEAETTFRGGNETTDLINPSEQLSYHFGNDAAILV